MKSYIKKFLNETINIQNRDEFEENDKMFQIETQKDSEEYLIFSDLIEKNEKIRKKSAVYQLNNGNILFEIEKSIKEIIINDLYDVYHKTFDESIMYWIKTIEDYEFI